MPRFIPEIFSTRDRGGGYAPLIISRGTGRCTMGINRSRQHATGTVPAALILREGRKFRTGIGLG